MSISISGSFVQDGGWGSWPTGMTTQPSTIQPTTTPAPEEQQPTTAQSFFEKQPTWSYYQPMNDTDMQTQAQEFSSIYAQPLYSELERKLEQAIADAQAQEQRIMGSFAGTEDLFRRRETEQGRQDLESAISRGAGRSGVVPHLSQYRQQHFSELLAAEEAKKNAEMYAIANQLGLVQRQIPQQRMEIADQMGRLTNQELQRLRDMEYTRGREHDLDQWARALSVFDRSQLTPLEQLQLYVALSQAMGETPAGMPTVQGF